MALDAGELTLTLEFAQGLKDKDLFGRQDPYCIVTVGAQRYKSRTHTDGGKNPVWNEVFRFNIINDNSVTIQVCEGSISPCNEPVPQGYGGPQHGDWGTRTI